jgi:molybdenum cofactor cytidylyltransferase
MIVAILLAAGLSSRTGKSNKLLRIYKKKPLILHSIENLKKSKVNKIYIILGKDSNEIKKVIKKDKKIQFIFNKNYKRGISFSIKAGLKKLSKKVNKFFICLADMPLVSHKIIDKMIKKSKHLNIPLIPYFKKQQGNPVLIPINFKEKLMKIKGDRGAKKIIKKKFITFQSTKSVTRDFDTIKDFKI